jgi:DsbC/DsbD-like thiol-disulfide interchange protein
VFVKGKPFAGLLRQMIENARRWCFTFQVQVFKPISAFLRFLMFGAAVIFCATVPRAAGTPIPHGTVELISESQSIAAGRPLYLGLHFQLEKGWHVYWVNPGDSGEPPRVKWDLPKGVSVGAIEWPTPRRLGTPSIVDFGYEDDVMLIVPVHVGAGFAAQQEARVGAEVKVLVCREMCIPGKAEVSVSLPVKSLQLAPDRKTSALFAAARKSMPRPAPASWRFRVIERKDSFELVGDAGHQITQASFFPLAESQIKNAAAQDIVPTSTGFRLKLTKSDQLLKPIERLKGVLVLSAVKAYSIDVPVGKPGAAKNSSGNEIRSTQSSQSSKEVTQK